MGTLQSTIFYNEDLLFKQLPYDHCTLWRNAAYFRLLSCNNFFPVTVIVNQVNLFERRSSWRAVMWFARHTNTGSNLSNSSLAILFTIRFTSFKFNLLLNERPISNEHFSSTTRRGCLFLIDLGVSFL